MNNNYRLIGTVLFSLLLIQSALADESQTDEYIQKWAAFTGYNLNNDAPSAPLSTLLNATNTSLAEQYSLFTLFGALTVNAVSTNYSAFAPTDSNYGKLLNPYANATFTNYQTPSSANSIAVSALIDQTAYPQKDPVSQFITNVLTIPNISYCMNNDGTAWLNPCPYSLYDTLVTFNVFGNSVPGPNDFFSYAYNQAIIPQLNSATLLSPLLYSTTSNESQSGSSSQSTSTSGLTATNQLQEAANFIRYLSSAIVKPAEVITSSDYNSAYTKATDTSTTANPTEVANAQNSIVSYLADVRSYAAKMSVAMNNLYGMLSSRMPQAQSNGTNTSAALSLFQLATRRLYDPAMASNNQWINQLDQASNATVNKEIAATLADILYMLYILHQDNEKQLLTASAGLIGSVVPPAFQELSAGGTDSSTTTPTS